MVRNCFRTTNYSISFHRGPDTLLCHSVGNQMVEVMKPNRNTNNIKIAVENANLYRKKYVMCALC